MPSVRRRSTRVELSWRVTRQGVRTGIVESQELLLDAVLHPLSWITAGRAQLNSTSYADSRS
jgi:hypothetical protein